jgi:DNA-binding transcriptional MerR regulator
VTLRSIGSVVTDLCGEFPDISVSKIRYLEQRGLVRPQRTAGGQRRYSPDDVGMIRRILRLQRDDYLPLEVIAEDLQHAPVGEEPTGATIAPARLRRSRERVMTADEFCDRSGIDAALLDSMRDHGLVDRLSEDGVAIARAVAALTRYGVEPRHLRPFRTSADRDVGLVEQALAPRRSGTAGKDIAAQRDEIATLLALLLDLHVALVRARSTTLET